MISRIKVRYIFFSPHQSPGIVPAWISQLGESPEPRQRQPPDHRRQQSPDHSRHQSPEPPQLNRAPVGRPAAQKRPAPPATDAPSPRRRRVIAAGNPLGLRDETYDSGKLRFFVCFGFAQIPNLCIGIRIRT